MIKAIALDDEPLGLNILELMCKNHQEVELLQTFTKPSEVAAYLENHAIDLIFLDIQMPSISGIDFFKSIKQNILVIFTTAYSEYAVEGFNVNAVDFLLKPFSQDRFNQAISKAINFNALQEYSKLQEPNFIQVKSAYSIVNINLTEVILIEGLDDYIKIHLPNKKFVVTRITMKKMMENLDPNQFIRIHRSFIIPIVKIESVRNKHVHIDTFTLPIGASYEDDFFKMFNSKSTPTN
jgi:DNA-binding LytR/AlgR family response regulator